MPHHCHEMGNSALPGAKNKKNRLANQKPRSATFTTAGQWLKRRWSVSRCQEGRNCLQLKQLCPTMRQALIILWRNCGAIGGMVFDSQGKAILDPFESFLIWAGLTEEIQQKYTTKKQSVNDFISLLGIASHCLEWPARNRSNGCFGGTARPMRCERGGPRWQRNDI